SSDARFQMPRRLLLLSPFFRPSSGGAKSPEDTPPTCANPTYYFNLCLSLHFASLPPLKCTCCIQGRGQVDALRTFAGILLAFGAGKSLDQSPDSPLISGRGQQKLTRRAKTYGAHTHPDESQKGQLEHFGSKTRRTSAHRAHLDLTHKMERKIPDFAGTWEMKTSENFEELLKKLGVNMMLRMIAVKAASKPLVEITQDGETLSIKTSTTVRTTHITFTVGQEFNEITVDGRPCTSHPRWETDSKISCEQTLQKGEGPKTSWTREITNDGKLILTMGADNVICSRVYERQ
ncbi:hypothetical protein KUCAC02_013956, partial [Chaenocephalus aceratus]